jgi:hypothetical protein
MKVFKLGGLYEKQVVATWNLGTISAFKRKALLNTVYKFGSCFRENTSSNITYVSLWRRLWKVCSLFRELYEFLYIFYGHYNKLLDVKAGGTHNGYRYGVVSYKASHAVRPFSNLLCDPIWVLSFLIHAPELCCKYQQTPSSESGRNLGRNAR